MGATTDTFTAAGSRPARYDVTVGGGGLAGLCAAAGFAAAGHEVLCIDPTPPVTLRDTAGADLRSTAILQPGQALLQRIGLWDRLAPMPATCG